ncbi:MAG: hypothetical protein UW11_C0014G0018 [Parcubacteria group bacterium GW2011_GWA2_43_9b]|nr:MAG: hypothetical protein UW11_C0014G0018 [Parcubacteria group bacterium GW2011_GWA2_43_9b]
MAISSRLAPLAVGSARTIIIAFLFFDQVPSGERETRGEVLDYASLRSNNNK